jgi:hypothetical protein
MAQPPPLAPETLAQAMRAQFEVVCRGIAAAVHHAPAGAVSNASADKVRNRFADFRPAAEQLLDYGTERRPMIQDPEFLEQGRPIGSGPTESRCRATPEGLKGVGLRGDAPHAEAVRALAALEQRGERSGYWALCLRGQA